MIIALILTLSAGTAVIALTGVLASAAQNESRREKDLRFKYSYEGVVERVRSQLADESISTPTTLSITVGGITWTVVVTDNGSKIAKTYSIQAQTNAYGKWTAMGAAVTNPGAVQAHHYVLASGGPVNVTVALNTGMVGDGDVYVDGTFTGVLATIDGDIKVTSGTAPIISLTTGTIKTGARPISIPKGTESDYLAAANKTIVVDTLTNLSFGTINEVQYRNGNLKLSGKITGWGTVYVNGNLEISANTSYNYYAYADANSCAAFIVNGDVIIDPLVTSFVGHFHAGGKIRFTNALPATLDCGSLYSVNGIAATTAVSLKFDPRIKDDQYFAVAMKIPGYWP